MNYLSLVYTISAVANLYFFKYANSMTETIFFAIATIGSILGAISFHPNWPSKPTE